MIGALGRTLNMLKRKSKFKPFPRLIFIPILIRRYFSKNILLVGMQGRTL
jgi:hypothetical protein